MNDIVEQLCESARLTKTTRFEAAVDEIKRLREENQQMRDTFAAIKKHCEPQPSPLTKSIALTCSRYL